MTKRFDISDIRLNEWRDVGRDRLAYYDVDIDAMLLFIKQPAGRYVASRIDDAVSLLYLSESKELIGVRVEAFYARFARNLRLRPRVWQLSNYDMFLEGSSDLSFTFYQNGEIVRAEGSLIDAYLAQESTSSPIVFANIPVPA